MNAKTLTIAAVAAAATFAAAGTTFAQEATPEYFLPQTFTSGVSRADVAQAAVAARHAGLIVEGERNVVAPSVSTLSRAQVRAEAVEARRLGLIAEGERNPVATPAQIERIRLAGESAVTALHAGR
jgi:hypothetical protein